MNEFNEYLIKKIKNLAETLTTLTKLMLGFGVVCLIFYLFRIGYFPTEVTIGDSLVFFIIAFSFGLIYFIFILSNFSLGYLIFLIIKIIFISFSKKNLINFIISNYSYLLIPVNLNFFKSNIFFDILAKLGNFLILSFLSLFIIFIYNFSPFNIFVILICSLATFIFLKLFHEEYTNKRNEDLYNGVIILPENELEKLRATNLLNKKRRMMAFLCIGIFTPLWGYISDQENFSLSTFSVNSLIVNKKNGSVFIKKEFSDLIPENFVNKDIKLENYIQVKNTTILLKGLGKNALLSFTFDNGDEIRREVPNEAISTEKLILNKKKAK